MGSVGGKLLDADDMRRLLGEIGGELARRGQVAEIAIYGGAALLLTFDNRPSTRDIDFIAVSEGRDDVQDAADGVGRRHGLPDGWFNDSVAMFASDRPDHRLLGDFPVGGPAGLRVFVPSPHYVLAMKLKAMRSSLESHDLRDIWNLADECGITTAAEAMAWHARFYPGDQLPMGGEDRLLDLFDDKAAGRSYDPMRYW